jgi:hypothetical protein
MPLGLTRVPPSARSPPQSVGPRLVPARERCLATRLGLSLPGRPSWSHHFIVADVSQLCDQWGRKATGFEFRARNSSHAPEACSPGGAPV